MIKLRLLTDSDFALVEKWLYKDHVRRWYEIPGMGITIEDWMQEIKAYKSEFSWITYQIVIWQDQPIGMCLYYQCSDSKDEDFGTLPLEGSYGIDYLIGEETCLRRGLGKELITKLTKEVLALPGAKRVTADVDSNNVASRKTLESCGFTLVPSSGARYVKEE